MQEQKISKGPTKIVDELTVSDDFNTGLTGVPVFTDGHISKYKPEQDTEWFRIYGSSLNDIKKGIIIRIKIGRKNEDFILGGDINFKERVKHDFRKFRKCYLAFYETSQGRMGIWPITEPYGRLTSNRWIDTAIQIVEIAQKKWVKYISHEETAAYQCFVAQDKEQKAFGEPKFKLDYDEVIIKAFGKDFTLNPDNYETNKYVQQMLGVQVPLKLVEEGKE